jgi:hypothetical protein
VWGSPLFFVLNGYLLGREYFELAAMRFIIRVMNAVAKRGVNRFSRGTATKTATIMPAMNTSKRSLATKLNGLGKRQMAPRLIEGVLQSGRIGIAVRGRKRPPCGSTNNLE